MFALYLEDRVCLLVSALAQLKVDHWRQLLDFFTGALAFLACTPDQAVPAPPGLPADVICHILRGVFCGEGALPPSCRACEPLWYLEAMLLIRILLQPTPGSDARGFRPPPLVAQFGVQALCSSSAAAFLFTMGALIREGAAPAAAEQENVGTAELWLAFGAAWARHGGDVLLACQHVLVRLYPHDSEVMLLHGAREPVHPGEAPSLIEVIFAASFHFSSRLLSFGTATSDGACQEGELAPPVAAAEPPLRPARCGPGRGSMFGNILAQLRLDEGCPRYSKMLADEFMVCLRDALHRYLGPCPASPGGLPEPVPALSAGADAASATSTPRSSVKSTAPHLTDIKIVARIVRTVVQAFFADPAMLAARRELDPDGPDPLYVGSSAGPWVAGDDVRLAGNNGPLRRSLVFMEQSPLLKVVQSKLCSQRFEDVVGATDQLSSFALRNLRVLWFDLRRCTCTLKREKACSGTASPRAAAQAQRGGGAVEAVVVLRHLRLGLKNDWEATVASFPYFQVEGSSQVTVKSLNIWVHLELSCAEGIIFSKVEVTPPDLEVQLSCTSSFSQVVLSSLVSLFQATISSHIQQQARQALLQMLQREASRWNSDVWRSVMLVVPESLISRGLRWIDTHIPPEGLPI